MQARYSEGLRGTSSLDGHETCDIVEFNITWGYLLMATGSGSYADLVECALFNAGMGAVSRDWSGVQYISCPNQLHIARNSCQVGHVGTAAALYGPNSDHRPKYKFITACCAGNINRMLPTYVQRMWMSSADGGVAAVLYGPSRMIAPVGENRQVVEILEETSYPFSEQITFRILSGETLKFPLHLRIPGWCLHPRLSINSEVSLLPPPKNGFTVLDRVHRPGDVITLELPMHTALGHSSDGGIFLERGPLVYCLQPREEWTPIPCRNLRSPRLTIFRCGRWQQSPNGIMRSLWMNLLHWISRCGFSPTRQVTISGRVHQSLWTFMPGASKDGSSFVPIKAIRNGS